MKIFIKVILGLILAGVLGFAGFVGYWMLTPNPDDLGNSAKISDHRGTDRPILAE